jgi:O-acetyl-ADP-ribose deacetylase (regulator of RNase III)
MGHLVHGMQEGRHFSAYYGDYCYLPLYIAVGDVVLWAQLRTSDRDGAEGVVPALEKIVAALRRRCKKARIIVRGDSGFCRDEIMAWCEGQPEIYYCLGLAKNSVLLAELTPALVRARLRHCLCGAPSVREFAEFQYRTQKSWSRARRVIGKAEVMSAGDNPRFIVTNLPAQGCKGDKDRKRFTPARLYEELYCARGEMENVLKQQVLDLQADALSTHHLASNQLRLWLAAFAYMLLERLRALGCRGTELARATAGSIRLKLLKVAAQVTVSVRRVYIQLSSAYPRQNLFRLCHARLMPVASADG